MPKCLVFWNTPQMDDYSHCIMLHHVRTNFSFYLWCDTWFILSFSLSHSSPSLKVPCNHQSTPSMWSICEIAKGYFFILEAHTLKILLSFSMVAGDIHLYPHVCTARTLLSTWLSLLFIWDNLLLNLDFPPPPWSWKRASPSQRKISTSVTVLFFWYFCNCSQMCHFPSKRGHNRVIHMHAL